MSNVPFLYPNVTSVPGKGGITPAERSEKREKGVPSEFDNVFDQMVDQKQGQPNLDQIRSPLKFSAHATQRLRERNIELDSATMSKINSAIDKADAKGVNDTLVLTQDAALIVNVKNRTVITAMDKNSLAQNVFTNIDGAVIV